ncbi:ribonuclease HII [Moraxella oculi]|uniref:Ribonuclease n=1 Tax=Moraxella oculi TaxID=2940516 RepID=A0ABW8U8U2_9GAMM
MKIHSQHIYDDQCAILVHKNHDIHSNHITIGVDEVGRGALFGHMTVSAVILDDDMTGEFDCIDLTDTPIAIINDSKKLSIKKRTLAYHAIKKTSQSHAIVDVPACVIDDIDIHQATLLGMRLAIENLITLNNLSPEHTTIIIDGDATPILACTFDAYQLGIQTLIKGDGLHSSVACASILAKVHRDAAIDNLAKNHPEYHLDRHKGYPTKAHIQAIHQHGILPQHRKSFNPIRTLLHQAKIPSMTGLSTPRMDQIIPF